MKRYIRVLVPIDITSSWLQNLKKSLGGFGINWADEKESFSYHLTLAYPKNDTDGIDLEGIVAKCMGEMTAPKIRFDWIRVFTTKKEDPYHKDKYLNDQHVISLSAGSVPTDFMEMESRLREALHVAGCKFDHGFKLHATLGTVKADDRRFIREDIEAKIDPLSEPNELITLGNVEILKEKTKDEELTTFEWK